MKKRSNRTLGAVVCALTLVVAVAQAQSEATYKELPNFHKVSDQLYRGAQPSDAGFKKLSELGIKTIVSLRGEDDINRAEKKAAEAAGLKYFTVAMPGLSAPSDEQVANVLAIIDDPNNQPVFIHCKRGADRTGTIGAIYRILKNGWTADKAIAEARRYGMSWAEFGMRSYISNYYKQHTGSQTPAAAVGATTTSK
jgi:tyrosine-protein phosphatase SIW14